ncbi:hypothetical protein [Massilibacteroides vaginae]|uniref:hypothetical protein n=1 Tax=Massilibacteroides vaginae TaxID=1673718 RepID=UPI000A1CD41D|nr:hypothetical protein [Massilibacteroides vaginae]
MWQEIAVACTGITTLLYVGWKVYSFIVAPKSTASSPCGGCTGCSLHHELKKQKKSCCGS